jgi:diguanylate cyclase (GGDEF)-like protein
MPPPDLMSPLPRGRPKGAARPTQADHTPPPAGAAGAFRELVELGELAARALDLDELLVGVAETVLRVTGAADCDIYRVADDGALRCLVSVDRNGRDASVTGEALALDGLGPNGPAVRTGELIVAADRADPCLTALDLDTFAEFGFESEVSVPLVSGGATIGLIEIFDTRPRDFAECLDYLRRVGQIVGGAYEKATALDRRAAQAARLNSLLESSRAVAATGRLEEALAIVARVAAEALGAPQCIVFELDAPGDAIVPRANYELHPSGWDNLGVPLPLCDHPAERALLRSGAALEEHVSDPDLDDGSRATLEKWGAKTCLTVPLKFGEDYRGLIAVYEHERERHFNDEEISLVRGLGEQAAAAIHNHQMVCRLEERNQRLAALVEAGAAMTADEGLDSVLPEVARQAVQALGCSYCIICEYEEATDTIRERAYHSGDPDDGYGLKSWVLDQDAWGTRDILSGGVVVEERVTDPAMNAAVRASMERWGEKTCLIVPLVFRDHPVGLLTLGEMSRERSFTADERDYATALGKQAGAAIHTSRQFSRLEEHNRVLTALLDTGKATTSTLQLDEVLRTLARESAKALDAPSCLIWEYIAERHVIAERECYEVLGEHHADGREEPLSDHPERELVLFADGPVVETLSDPLLHPLSRASMERWGEKTSLSVPIVFGDERLGVIVYGETRAERAFTQTELELAAGLADRAAVAIHNARLYRDLERNNQELAARVRRERFINESSAEMSSSLDLDAILDSAAKRFAAHFGVAACDVYRLDAHGDLVCTASVVDGASCLDWVGVRLAIEDCAIDAIAVETARSVMVSSPDDARLSPYEGRAMREWALKSDLVVPIVAKERVLGTINLLDTSERVFSDEEIATAEAVCGMVGLAMENAGLFAAQQEHAHRLASLVAAGHSIASPVVAEDVLATIAQRAAEAMGSPECLIYEFDPEADTLTARAIFQEHPTVYQDMDKPYPLDDWPLDRVVLMGSKILVETLSDPGLDPTSRASMVESGEKTCVSAPLSFGAEPLGILVLMETEQERTFSDDDLAVLSGLSTQASIALHHARLFERLEARTFETEVLNEIARAAASSLNLAEIAEATVTSLQRLVRFDSSSLLQALPDGSLHLAFATAGQSSLESLKLDDLDGAFLERLEHDRVVVAGSQCDIPLCATHPVFHDVRSAAIVGLFDGGELAGALTLGNRGGGGFSHADRRVLEGVGAHLSLALKNVRYYDTAKHLHLGNLKALSSALLAKDYYTIGHTARVATYAVLLAAELGWSRSLVDEVEEIAYLHDIGKIAVSDQVLLKTGSLTDEEWELMRQHPVISAEIIEPLLDDDLVAGVRHHHEHYDGSGYPDGLAGEDIPEIARLMAVVDAYDAMSSRRVYRSPLTFSQCIEELDRCRGKQFDPKMVDAFLRVLRGMQTKKRRAAAAAKQAAALISAEKHALLRTAADMERPEYAELSSLLREVKRDHPAVAMLTTEVLADDLRVMLVVDADEDPQSHAPIGQLMFADNEELHALRGQPTEANVVNVDAWGAWVAGLAPVVDASGDVVAVVCADAYAADAPGLTLARSRISETFSSIASCAAERLTRAEVDAMTDPLTGLYNHRYLQQRLEEELLSPAQGGAELSLLFCDVDKFKALNDRHGHGAGDEALKAIAQIVKRTVRRFDLAARYGGDEFAVILPGVGAVEAEEIAERMRWSVEHAAVHPLGERMTLSLGIATAPADGATKDELLHAADTAMYRAKRSGRNRCESFNGGAATAAGAPRAADDGPAAAPAPCRDVPLV